MDGLNNLRGYLTCAGLSVLLLLTGCGGGGGGESAASTNNVVSNNLSDVSTTSGAGGATTGAGGSGGGSAPEPIVVEVIDTVVTWGAPVARENGDFLREVDLLNYYVYYGLVAGDYQNRIDVVSSADPQVDLIDLPSGVYFLVITSVDTEGRESLYSDEFTVAL